MTERRFNFRCAIADEPGKAVLRQGRQDTAVELLDQSAGGFAVAGDALRGQLGQRLLLRTNRGWSEVEIVRREQEGKRVTLGLQQVEDLPDPREMDEMFANRVVWRPWARTASSGGTSALTYVLMVGMGSVILFWVAMLAIARLGLVRS